MTIKHQPQNEKHPYASPTTPGLYVTFRAYIIELICLNVDRSIGPRFWSDKKYWGPKFRREVKGIDNVLKTLDSKDPLIQTALVQTIKQNNIKSLSYSTTVKKVVKYTIIRRGDLKRQRDILQEKTPTKEIDAKKNSTFVDTGEKGVLGKIREEENG